MNPTQAMTPRLCALVAFALATSASAQTGPSVCASILMGDDKVACMKAIAGHTVESGAAAVCAQALMAEEKTACLRGALDKRYSPEELATCRTVLMGDDKAACMAAAGTNPRRDDEEPAPARHRRSRRALDDDRDDERARRGPASRWARLTNSSAQTVTRLFWRRPDDTGFREVSLQSPVRRDQYLDVMLPNEAVQVCVESSRGLRLFWPLVRRDQSLSISESERGWVDADCLDVP